MVHNDEDLGDRGSNNGGVFLYGRGVKELSGNPPERKSFVTDEYEGRRDGEGFPLFVRFYVVRSRSISLTHVYYTKEKILKVYVKSKHVKPKVNFLRQFQFLTEVTLRFEKTKRGYATVVSMTIPSQNSKSKRNYVTCPLWGCLTIRHMVHNTETTPGPYKVPHTPYPVH